MTCEFFTTISTSFDMVSMEMASKLLVKSTVSGLKDEVILKDIFFSF